MPIPKVENMTSPSSGREVANQFLIKIGGTEYFQSYDSIIGMWDKDGITLDETYWEYSTTTAKYRNQWLRMNKAQIQERIKNGSIKLANLN